MALMQACKPGLGALLGGRMGVAVNTRLTVVTTAAVAAALGVNGAVPLASRADAGIKGAGEQALPKTFISLFDPLSVALIFARNVGLHALIRFNLYMIELNEYELKRFEAEDQGSLPPVPPQMGRVADWLHQGLWNGCRELATNTVRLIYEHVLLWRLGPDRATPFLRNGAARVVHVLQPRYASSSTGKQVFSYTFALLHAHALYYAAECTVAVGLSAAGVLRDKRHRPKAKAHFMVRSVAFQLARCSLLLASTSLVAALGTLVYPGLGTKAGLLFTDTAVNYAVAPAARALQLL